MVRDRGLISFACEYQDISQIESMKNFSGHSVYSLE